MRRLLLLGIPLGLARSSAAQGPANPITRQEAIATTVARGARLRFAGADTIAALGQLLGARAFPNPAVSAGYSKSAPRYHLSLDLPLEYPWQRSPRIGSARASRTSAAYRYRFERAAVELDADTAYTRALIAQARAQLSRRNAVAADSLRQIAAARRDAGDASDLDVELASIFAGQQANAATVDSLDHLTTLLGLQVIMGLGADSVRIILADSLAPPPPDSATAPSGTPLVIAAATTDLQAAELGLRAERRNLFGPPSLSAGFETYDPGGGEPGTLPTVGVSIPLPLFNRNRGPIVTAQAERDRAQAALTLARIESQAEIARALRDRELALARVARDQQLVQSANRVATLSLIAFREGAAPLANVLEAQRNAREVLAGYLDDLAAAWIAVAVARLVTLTATEELP